MTVTPPLRAPDPLASSRRRALRRLGALKAKPLGSIGDIGGHSFGSVDKITWEDAADWDDANDEERVVHEDLGDFVESEISLGFPIRDDHLAYWHLHDDGGPVEDAIDGNDASEDGNPSYGATGVLGTDAVDFAGDGGFNAGKSSAWEFGSGEAFTVNVVLRWPDNTTDRQMIVGNGGGWGSEGFILFATVDDNDDWDIRWEVGEDGSTNYTRDIDDGDLTAGTWYLITATHPADGNVGNVYYNESDNVSTVSDDSVTGSIVGEYDLGIGKEFFASGGGPDDTPFTDKMAFVQIHEGEWSKSDHDDYYQTLLGGHLTTATKSFGGSTQPDLSDLDYELNGESIDVEVIGSPGSGSEETVQQSLDGSSSYNLSWSDSHTDFRVRVDIDTEDKEASPTLNRLSLAG